MFDIVGCHWRYSWLLMMIYQWYISIVQSDYKSDLWLLVHYRPIKTRLMASNIGISSKFRSNHCQKYENNPEIELWIHKLDKISSTRCERDKFQTYLSVGDNWKSKFGKYPVKTKSSWCGSTKAHDHFTNKHGMANKKNE